MDAARDRFTLEIVEAEDLKLLECVDTYGYTCHGHECGIQVFPSSYRLENLLRAHFFAKASHTSSCDVVGEDDLRSRGKKGSVARELETGPGLSPSSLQLVDTRAIVNGQVMQDGTQSKGGSRTIASSGETRQRPVSRRPANSIRPICRAFMEFPYDRHLPLHIDGIQTSTYQMVFKRLRSEGIEVLPRQRIFYAELAWQQAYEATEGLVVPLNAGEWHEKRLTPYCIVVQRTRWSQTARTRLDNELEIARRENMAAKKTKDARRTYAFFIGTQNPENLSHFVVSDQRLICTVHGKLIFPKQQ